MQYNQRNVNKNGVFRTGERQVVQLTICVFFSGEYVWYSSENMFVIIRRTCAILLEEYVCYYWGNMCVINRRICVGDNFCYSLMIYI